MVKIGVAVPNSGVARSLAEETGADTAVLDPLEGLTDASEGSDYLEVMRSNLAALRAAPDAEIEPRVGGAFHVHMDPLAQPGMKGADEMRYMALQPPTMLSFDWNAPPHLPLARAQRTLVIVRLKAIDANSTRVSLHHVGWGDGDEWDQAYLYFDRAWAGVLGNLIVRVVSSPFTFLASLAGADAPELSHIAFAPGGGTLDVDRAVPPIFAAPVRVTAYPAPGAAASVPASEAASTSPTSIDPASPASAGACRTSTPRWRRRPTASARP